MWVKNWESQDEPEHLRTIRDQILRHKKFTGRLLGLLQQIVQEQEIKADESPEQMELRLTGLVVRREAKLRTYNRIYALVFNQNWVNKALAELRPYAESLNAWNIYDSKDESRLLRGQALRDAIIWATDKNLSQLDYQFLTASQELERKEEQKALELKRQALEAEQAKKALEAEKQANQILAEAQQKAELALEEERKTNQRAKQVIRRGLFGLATISSVAIAVVVWAGISSQDAQQKLKHANFQTEQVLTKLNQLKKDSTIQDAKQKIAKAFIELGQAQKNIQAASQNEKSAKQRLELVTLELSKAQQKAQLAAKKVEFANERLKKATQEVIFARSELHKAEKQTKIALEIKSAAVQRVEQANQEVISARSELENAKKDTEIANATKIAAEKEAQKAKQEIASVQKQLEDAKKNTEIANVEREAAENKAQQANQEVQNLSLLSELGGKLYKAGKSSEAEQAWKQAVLSLEMQEHGLKQAMLLSHISQAYLQLDQLSQAEQAINESLKRLQTSRHKKQLPMLVQALNTKTSLLKAKGDINKAFAINTEAFNLIKSLQSDLSINSKINMRDKSIIESTSHNLISLLLASKNPSYKNLKKALIVIDTLHFEKFNNYSRLAYSDAKLEQLYEMQKSGTAIIYPIILDDRLVVIVKMPGQKIALNTTMISKNELKNTVIDLRDSLESRFGTTRSGDIYLNQSQKVYDLLIRPIEAELVSRKINTLVFVPDSYLRYIPITVLYDGENFLIEKYAIGITPSLQFIDAKPSKPVKLSVLSAGISASVEPFSALPGVEKELSQISKISSSSTFILNSYFTLANLQNAINSSSFPVVHLATHASFSPKQEGNFILAWDEKINLDKFYNIFRMANQRRSSPIDLLVLSSVGTAVGDENTPLGFAGVALQSGVKSSLASLWSVEDRSTALLMGEFYKALASDASITKAEALRQAQLSLLKEDAYSNPYYWASFVLIGNWQ